MSVAAAGREASFPPTKVARLLSVLLVYERAQLGQLLAAQEIDPVALDPREQVLAQWRPGPRSPLVRDLDRRKQDASS
jgi:hypothetical protein